jgi:hypothetical protein
MARYWIGFTVDNAQGMAGSGGCEMQLAALPESVNDINQLSDHLTEDGRAAGRLGRDQWVTVQSWSRMAN